MRCSGELEELTGKRVRLDLPQAPGPQKEPGLAEPGRAD